MSNTINTPDPAQPFGSAVIRAETNKRMYDRNLPSGMLQPYISVRPVMTKYSILPIVDPRKDLTVNMPVYPTYNMSQTFNPGNDEGPWSGFASQINTESDLRNQIFALQRCPQSVYVPNSTSDLYQSSFTPKMNYLQPFPDLFKEEQFNEFNPNPNPTVTPNVFYTPTRIDSRYPNLETHHLTKEPA